MTNAIDKTTRTVSARSMRAERSSGLVIEESADPRLIITATSSIAINVFIFFAQSGPPPALLNPMQFSTVYQLSQRNRAFVRGGSNRRA